MSFLCLSVGRYGILDGSQGVSRLGVPVWKFCLVYQLCTTSGTRDSSSSQVFTDSTVSQVPADGVLIEGHSLTIDESTMTGESEPVSSHFFSDNFQYILYLKSQALTTGLVSSSKDLIGQMYAQWSFDGN